MPAMSSRSPDTGMPTDLRTLRGSWPLKPGPYGHMAVKTRPMWACGSKLQTRLGSVMVGQTHCRARITGTPAETACTLPGLGQTDISTSGASSSLGMLQRRWYGYCQTQPACAMQLHRAPSFWGLGPGRGPKL